MKSWQSTTWTLSSKHSSSRRINCYTVSSFPVVVFMSKHLRTQGAFMLTMSRIFLIIIINFYECSAILFFTYSKVFNFLFEISIKLHFFFSFWNYFKNTLIWKNHYFLFSCKYLIMNMFWYFLFVLTHTYIYCHAFLFQAKTGARSGF